MPSHGTSPRSQAEPLFVGFAGRIGAGKTAAAEYLRDKHHFQYARYSQVLRDWRASEATTLDGLREIGWEVMSCDQAELNAILIAGLDRSRSAAIDGLRHPIDFRSLTDAFGPAFHLIYLEAGAEPRFRRHGMKYHTREAFVAADSHRVEAQIDDVRPFAAATIQNEGSLDELHGALDDWLAAAETGVRT
jgi:dephospho-CoA kinase